jgi:transcriptional regulator with XRE-family HTH domain
MHILRAMDPLQIVDKLKQRGLSEYAIAKRSKELGKPVSQSTVNRIATGEISNTSLETLRALELVLASVPPKPRSPKRATSALTA